MSYAHIVFAHPARQSLNHELLKCSTKMLDTLSVKTTVTDLYRMHQADHPATKPYGIQCEDAVLENIKQEQEKIKAAGLLILQFPLYWFSIPSIMQSYFEQVLTPGFAYPGTFEHSPLCDGRKVLFSLTTQSSEEDYQAQGMIGTDIKGILRPLAVAMRFVGYQILQPLSFCHVDAMSDETFSQAQLQLEKQLQQTIRKPEIWLVP
jgi:NAD(P)H dehydrogenase (quinone)